MVKISDYWLNLVSSLPNLPKPQGDMSILQGVGIKACLEQEFSQRADISIPGPVMDIYRLIGRPRPLVRAKLLEKALGTPARIWLKLEGDSPTGSHKINTAIPQAHFAKVEGFKGMVTETGAGQWGTALACAGALQGIPVSVFWVNAMYRAKSERLDFMKLYGAKVFASPSNETECGRRLRAQNPEHSGSLGIAISESVEYARANGFCCAIGSVMNHVLLHQTVIGLEAYEQARVFEFYPDFVVSCFGGGSNFGGLAIPFIWDCLLNVAPKSVTFVVAQNESAPNLTGTYEYEHPDHEGILPKFKMRTLGRSWEGAPIAGDGLRYHGASPMLSYIMENHPDLFEVMVFPSDEREVFAAALTTLNCTGRLLALESAHAMAATIRLAERAKQENRPYDILTNLSGHGLLDMTAYRQHLLRA